MVFNPEVISKMAQEWDPEPFNSALDQASAQKMAQQAQMMQGTMPQAPGYAQMLGGAPQMGAPAPAPAPAPMMQPLAPAQMQPQPGVVPNLSTILGMR